MWPNVSLTGAELSKYCQQWRRRRRRRRRVIHNDNPCVNCVKKDYIYAKELWDLIRFESSVPILCHLEVAVQFKTFSQRASKVFIYNAVFHIPWPMLQWRPNLWASNTQTGAFCWQCVGMDTETVEYELDKQATVRQLAVTISDDKLTICYEDLINKLTVHTMSVQIKSKDMQM